MRLLERTQETSPGGPFDSAASLDYYQLPLGQLALWHVQGHGSATDSLAKKEDTGSKKGLVLSPGLLIGK